MQPISYKIECKTLTLGVRFRAGIPTSHRRFLAGFGPSVARLRTGGTMFKGLRRAPGADPREQFPSGGDADLRAERVRTARLPGRKTVQSVRSGRAVTLAVTLGGPLTRNHRHLQASVRGPDRAPSAGKAVTVWDLCTTTVERRRT